MSMRKIFPIVRTIFSKQIKMVDAKIEEAKKAYESGDKQRALSLCKEILEIDGSCKAVRGKMGKISVELEEEKSHKLK